MKYPEFLQEVRELPFKFVLRKSKIVTKDAARYCPWAAWVMHRQSEDGDQVFNNRRDITPRIWDAADNGEGHDPEIRKDLLKACHIQCT